LIAVIEYDRYRDFANKALIAINEYDRHRGFANKALIAINEYDRHRGFANKALIAVVGITIARVGRICGPFSRTTATAFGHGSAPNAGILAAVAEP
jgi:hypothetical protein